MIGVTETCKPLSCSELVCIYMGDRQALIFLAPPLCLLECNEQGPGVGDSEDGGWRQTSLGWRREVH